MHTATGDVDSFVLDSTCRTLWSNFETYNFCLVATQPWTVAHLNVISRAVKHTTGVSLFQFFMSFKNDVLCQPTRASEMEVICNNI